MLLTGKPGLAALLAEYGGSAKDMPDIAGHYAGGNLIICGDAAGVWDDLEAFGCRANDGKGSVAKPGWDFMAVNKLGETFPGEIEHWYSNAGHLLARWLAARRTEYEREFTPPRHTHSCQSGAMWQWPWGGHGTSGLGAVFVGLALGYDRIVLCGMPLDDGPHNGEPKWRRTKFASSEAMGEGGGPDRHWARLIAILKGGTLTSMSGRTREWFGAPIDR